MTLWVGCGGSSGDGDGSGTGDDGGDGMEAPDPDADADADADGGTGQSGPLQHGSVQLEFRRGTGVAVDPFVGTTTIQVTLSYMTCLVEFYAANPNWQSNGPDGASLFGALSEGGEGWRDRLCDLGNVDCEVVAFDQQLGGASSSLSVTYAVTGAIENRTLHFGPVPLPALANCSGDAPTVRIATNGAVRGLDGVPPAGNVLWAMQTFSPDTAAPDQGASMVVDVEPVE